MLKPDENLTRAILAAIDTQPGIRLVILFGSLAAGRERVIALMQRYAQVPMAFADACLFCMAEQLPERTVFTLDSHFVVYRLANGLPANTLRPQT